MEDLEEKLNVSVNSEVLSMNDKNSHVWLNTEEVVSKVVSSFSIEMEKPVSSMTQHMTGDHTKRPFLAYSFMALAVAGMTCIHTFVKVAFTRKPTLTNVDVVLFFGIWMTLVYSIWSKLNGVSLSLANLPQRPLKGLFVSLLMAIL